MFQHNMFGKKLGISLCFLLTSFAYAEVKIAIDRFYVEIAPYILDDFKRVYEEIGEEPIISIFPSERAIKLVSSGDYQALDARFSNPTVFKDLIKVNVPIYGKGQTYAWAIDDSIQLKTAEDINNYRAVGTLGSAINSELKRKFQLNLFQVDTLEQAIQMIESGRMDILLTSDIFMNQEKLNGFGLGLSTASPSLHSEWVYHHVHKSREDLVPKLESMIKKLKDEEGLFLLR